MRLECCYCTCMCKQQIVLFKKSHEFGDSGLKATLLSVKQLYYWKLMKCTYVTLVTKNFQQQDCLSARIEENLSDEAIWFHAKSPGCEHSGKYFDAIEVLNTYYSLLCQIQNDKLLISWFRFPSVDLSCRTVVPSSDCYETWQVFCFVVQFLCISSQLWNWPQHVISARVRILFAVEMDVFVD